MVLSGSAKPRDGHPGASSGSGLVEVLEDRIEEGEDRVAGDDARGEDLHVALPARAAQLLPNQPAEDARQHSPARHRERDQQAGGEEHADLPLRAADKLQDRAGELEASIERLETEIAGIESQLADFKSVEETMRLTELLDQRRRELTSAMEEWEEVSETIEANS